MQLDNIVADDDVIEHRLQNEWVSLYTDVHIAREKNIRVSFLKRLCRCGILGATQTRNGTVALFFCQKEKWNQRLVLDWRDVNRYFRKPPKPEMAAAESIQRMESP